MLFLAVEQRAIDPIYLTVAKTSTVPLPIAVWAEKMMPLWENTILLGPQCSVIRYHLMEVLEGLMAH